MSALGLLSFLRRNIPERCTLLAVKDFHFLDVKESHVNIRIYGDCGIFCCTVYRQYTEEISHFECVSSFYGTLACFGRLYYCFFLMFFPRSRYVLYF